ncbi:MAG: class I mannose-6-phosphate isomerase [Propioniciclava sp.]
MSASYEVRPVTPTGVSGQVDAGWEAVAATLARQDSHLYVVESYPGTDDAAVARELSARIGIDTVVHSGEIFPDGAELTRFLQPWLTEDRVFGRMFFGTIHDLVDADRLAAVRRRVQTLLGRVLVIGFGASLISEGGVRVYADITRWEIQRRWRQGTLGNWLADNAEEDLLRRFKRGYFIEWRVADRWKVSQLPASDYYLETNTVPRPTLVATPTYLAALEAVTRRPFRMVPYFDAGVWGGTWLQDQLGIPMEGENIAWGFDGVPEENSIVLAIGDGEIEVPAQNLVKVFPTALLGEEVVARFGAEFPIRFDFLDTIGGQNLSLQVHPTVEYIREHFGMAYTQDESYYILEAGPDAGVYLGLREDSEPQAMVAELTAAESGAVSFEAERHVNRYPAKRHDHFLIPAGTVHCSAADTLVLEISATPYIFTFKLWDWDRVGLDGVPRPTHVGHGQHVIDWSRTDAWVRENLTPQPQVLRQTDDVLIERTGLHRLEFIETVRYTTRSEVRVASDGGFSMLNLVEGAAAEVSSPDGTFEPYLVHYAETFIVPARVEDFVVRPAAGVAEIKVVRAFVRKQRAHTS